MKPAMDEMFLKWEGEAPDVSYLNDNTSILTLSYPDDFDDEGNCDFL